MVALRFRLLVLLAVCVAFGGALWAPFYLEDEALTTSPILTDPAGWRDLLKPGEQRPLTALTFWIQLQFSQEAWTFHAVSLLLHAACVWVAIGVLERWLPMLPARIAAAVFAFHPLQAQAVIYVSARATLLAALFGLLSIRQWQRGRLWRAVVWFALALAAKEEAAALPLALGLSEWAVERRRDAVRPLLAMLACALLMGVGGLWAAAGGVSVEYFSFQGVAILRSLLMLLVPIGFTPDPAIRTGAWPASLAWGAVAAVFALALSGVRARGPGFYLAAGLLLLLPSSSVFPAGALAADYRMYLPLVFLGPFLGLLLQRADPRLLAALAVIWCGAAFFQTRLWQNPQALWMEAARLSPDTIVAKRQLAALLPVAQAVELLEDAARLQPGDGAIQADMGMAWLRAGEPARAAEAFSRAMVMEPLAAKHSYHRGLARLQLGQLDKARADFVNALDQDACLLEALAELRRMGYGRVPPAACRYSPAQRKLLASWEP